MANSTVRVMDSTGGINISFHGTPDGNGTWGTGSARGVYVMSEERNQFVVTGCNVLATLLGDTGNVIIGCSSFCSINDRFMSSPSVNALTGIYVGECSGIGCCQTAIPIGRPSCGMQFRMLARPQPRARQQAAHRGAHRRTRAVPVVLDWAVESGRKMSQRRRAAPWTRPGARARAATAHAATSPATTAAATCASARADTRATLTSLTVAKISTSVRCRGIQYMLRRAQHQIK